MEEARIINLCLVKQKMRQEAFFWANEVLEELDQPKESVRILLDDDSAYVKYRCIPSLFCNREDGRVIFRRDWLDDSAFSCHIVANIGELCARYSAERIDRLFENGVNIHRYFTVPNAPRPEHKIPS